MSVTSAGLTSLTAMIYQSIEDGATARRRLNETLRINPMDYQQIEHARLKANFEGAFLAGLVKAWETVTGQIWGEVLPGWRSTTT